MGGFFILVYTVIYMPAKKEIPPHLLSLQRKHSLSLKSLSLREKKLLSAAMSGLSWDEWNEPTNIQNQEEGKKIARTKEIVSSRIKSVMFMKNLMKNVPNIFLWFIVLIIVVFLIFLFKNLILDIWYCNILQQGCPSFLLKKY